MLKRIQSPLLILLSFTLLGCHATTTRYSSTPSLLQTGNIQASRNHGINKPGGKLFPIGHFVGRRLEKTSITAVDDLVTGGSVLLYWSGFFLVDLALTPVTFLYGYKHFDILDVNGNLQGILHASGNSIPTTQQMTLVIGSQSTPIQVGADGHFTLPFNLRNELFHKGLIKFSVVFPWKDTLTENGEVLKPTPDTFEYMLRLKSDKSIELVNSSKKTLTSLEITPTYENVRDEARIKEVAEEKRIAEEMRVKELAERKIALAKKMTQAYKRSEITKLAESFAQEVVNSTNRHSRPDPIRTGSMVMFNDPTIPNAIERYSWSLGEIKWLNSEKTKAKALANIKIYFNAGIVATTGNSGGNVADSFVCECDANGDWSITNWGRIISQE